MFALQVFCLSVWFVTSCWATSCCPSLDVSSHSLSLGGSFQRKGSWGDRPIYLDSLNNLFLYFLPMRVGGLWMIGPHIGEVGVLGHVGDVPCPADISSDSWQYRVGASWLLDQSIEMTCSQQHVKMDIQEIKGSFTMKSLEYPEKIGIANLSDDIEKSLGDMLSGEKEVSDQVEFKVSVENILLGDGEVDFKIQYNMKESFQVVPFEIRPVNVSEVLNQDFKYRRGILFEKFPVDEDSFHCSDSSPVSVVDTCAELDCSHQCGYDYDREEFVCTCPPPFTLDHSNSSCTTDTPSTTTLPSNTDIPTTLPTTLCSDCFLKDGDITTTPAIFVATTETGTEPSTEREENENDNDKEFSTLIPTTIVNNVDDLDLESGETNFLLPVYIEDETRNLTNYQADLEMDMTAMMELVSSNAIVDEEGVKMLMFDCVKADNEEIDRSESQTVLRCKILDKETGENIFIVVDKNVVSQSVNP